MGLHLLGLWTLAVVHPLLDALARSPEFFVAHRSTPAHILLLLAALLFAIPGAGLLALRATGIASPRARDLASRAALALLTGAIALQAAKAAGVGWWLPALLAAAAGGAGALYVYLRSAQARLFATIVSVGALVAVPAMFVQSAEVRSLLGLGRRAGAADVSGTGAAGGGARPIDVVLIVFDQVSLVSLLDADGAIDAALYPGLAALAHDGVWYRDTTTVSDFTRWALPSILTGRYPRSEELPTPADHPDTLFRLLAPSHRVHASEAVTDLCPREICASSAIPWSERVARMTSDLWLVYRHVLATEDLRATLPQLSGDWAGFEEERADSGDIGSRRPAWERRWRRARRENKVGLARAFVESVGVDARPTFHFLHTMLTHMPYTMLPGGRRSSTRVDLGGRARERWADDPWAAAQHEQQHLLQLAFADSLVIDLVDRLRASGRYDDALIIVTSDHGVAFRPGLPLREFEETIAAEIARVPLIVKYPGDAGRSGQIVTQPAETVDIVPTIADVLRVQLPWRVDGRSLLAPPRPRPERRLWFADARRSVTFAPGEPDVSEALRRKIERFGGAANVYRIPRLPALAHLVGKQVKDLPVREGESAVHVNTPGAFQFVTTGADAVPFEVSGTVGGRDLQEGVARLAVAVNGVVRAVTQTWTHPRGHWVATPPLDAWREGPNELEVFLVRDGGGRTELVRGFRLAPRPADLDLMSREAGRYAVERRGFHGEERAGGRAFRWTNGHGVITTRAFPGARHLLLTLAMTGRGDRRLTVSVNGCQVFEGDVRGAWRGRFALDACDLSGETWTVELRSNTFTPQGRDRRTLGVGVQRVSFE